MKTQKEESKEVEGELPEKQKMAFFITPLGHDTSDIRRATNGMIEAVIRPVLVKHDIYLIPPHEILIPGNITKQIVRHILDADLVIANLTGLNANVMYELAIRHAARKPVIVIAQQDTKLPFDVAAERTIFYDNDMAGVVKLIEDLDKVIPEALNDKKPDNPIYNGIESSLIHEALEKEKDPVQSYIVEKLDQLGDMVSFLRNNSNIKTVEPKEVIGLRLFTLSFEGSLSVEDFTKIKFILDSSIPLMGSIKRTANKEDGFYNNVTFRSTVKEIPSSTEHAFKDAGYNLYSYTSMTL